MTDPNFYDIEATLDPRRDCYVTRQADDDLVKVLVERKYSFVLSSRKVGKSSLLKRSFITLRNQGIRIAYHELASGNTSDTNEEQWYFGVAMGLFVGSRLPAESGLDDSCRRWWNEYLQLPPMQRLILFVREYFLARTEEPWILAIDEIDTTISLPFTDNFFAGIRACYNARSDDPLFRRLTFLLVGVASPNHLVKDAMRTPFNIGTRVEIADFTMAQASILLRGLGERIDSEHPALQRVHYWTDGHPYLTQRVFYQVACKLENKASPSEAGDWCSLVDGVVEEAFFNLAVFVNESHFKNIAESRVKTFPDRPHLLKIYRRARRKPVADDPLSPAKTELKLAGLLKTTGGGKLCVSNRIYRRVFDERWIGETMPRDFRVLAWGAAILALTASVVGFYVLVPAVYIEQLRTADRDLPIEAHRRLASIPGYKVKADELLARFWDKRAERNVKEGPLDFTLVYRLCAAKASSSERRWRLAEELVTLAPLRATFRAQSNSLAVAFGPDSSSVLTGSDDGTAWLWEMLTGNPKGVFQHGGAIRAAAFSSDGRLLLTGGDSGAASLWDMHTGDLIITLQHGGAIRAVAFSPDGSLVLTGSEEGVAQLSAVPSGRRWGKPLVHVGVVGAVAFSFDGTLMLTGTEDGVAQLWEVRDCLQYNAPFGVYQPVRAVAFSPNGKFVVTGDALGSAQVRDIITGEVIGTLRHKRAIRVVTFSPDSSLVLTGSEDGTAQIWDVLTCKQRAVFQHGGPVGAVAFSPDGSLVLTGSEDGTTRLWETLLAIGGAEHSDRAWLRRSLVEDWLKRTSLRFSRDGVTLLPRFSNPAKRDEAPNSRPQ